MNKKQKKKTQKPKQQQKNDQSDKSGQWSFQLNTLCPIEESHISISFCQLYKLPMEFISSLSAANSHVSVYVCVFSLSIG